MKATPFQAFLELVKFDQQFHDLSTQLRTHKQELASIEKELKDLDTREQELRRRVHDARKSADEHELGMKELVQSESDRKERLEKITHQKEYEALKKEIAGIRQRQQEYEKELVAAWNRVDTIQKELKSSHDQIEQRRTQLMVVFAQKKDQIADLEKKFAHYEQGRMVLLKDVPPEWIDKYNMMRELVTDPVVPVVHGSCGSCFYAIPANVLVALRKGKLVQCKDCYRLLYMESEQTPGA